MSTSVAPTLVDLKCPLCRKRMWDNRQRKTNPKQPDFKCSDPICDGAIWPTKPRQRTAPPLKLEQHAPPTQAPVSQPEAPAAPAVPTHEERVKAMFAMHAKCYKHVIENYVALAVQHGIVPTLEGISALTYQIFRSHQDIR